MIFTRSQWYALAGFGVLLAATWWRAPWPATQAMHHSLTVLALVGLGLVCRRYRMPLGSFVLVLVFLALHSIAARWLYSYVPYDSWTEAVGGFRLSEVFGWRRNHFDRLVHLSYGLCLSPVLYRYLREARGWRVGWAALCAVDVVVSTGAIYELLEWGVSLLVSPAVAADYNGQQGDMWDAQKDMTIALLGGVVGVAWPLFREIGGLDGARRPLFRR